MNEIAAWQGDLLVYLVPGYVILLALVYSRDPSLVTKEKLGAGQVLGSAVAALLIGIVVHQASTVALAGFQRLFGYPTFSAIAASFGHVDAACQKVTQDLAIKPHDPGDCYFCARAYVAKSSPTIAESNERLLRLANVCQNMIIAVLGAMFITAIWPSRTDITLRLRVVIALGGLVLVLVFGYGMDKYWTAAVFRTFRAVLLP